MTWAKVKAVAALAVGVLGGGVVFAASVVTPETARPAPAKQEAVTPYAPTLLQAVVPGTNDVPKEFTPNTMAFLGEYLYVGEAGYQNKACKISYFKRNADGSLAYGGTLPISRPAELCTAGGRLYALLGTYNHNIVTWYDIDPATGKPVEKGTNINIGVEWAGSLRADAEGKNLYLWGGKWPAKLVWFRIGASGAPEKAGELAGGGIPGLPGNSLCLTPDGKNIYCAGGGAIACIARKTDGSIALKTNVSLSVMDQGVSIASSATVHCSPDGQWVYVSLFRWGDPGCSFGVFKRDTATGSLTLQEAGSGNDGTRPDFKLSNFNTLNLVFLPDGSGGYAGTAHGALLQNFRCDPKTGHISDVVDVTAIDYRQFSTAALLLDSKQGILFGTGRGGIAQGLWALKAEKPPAAGSRTDIQTPLVGTTVMDPSSPLGSDAASWPRWRGANCDSKSPLKGIRKDWTGGLKKVWEVKGLSPGTCTYSAPCVKGNKLVVMGRHGAVDEVFCFDADKGGKPLWIAEYSATGGDYGWGEGPQSTPCIDSNLVFFTSRGGNFACARMEDGRILWRKGLGHDNHGYGSAPLVWGDLVIMPAGGHALSAFKKETGEKVWGYGDGPGGEGRLCFVSPVLATIGGKEQIVFYFGKHVCGIDPATGKAIWDAELPAAAQNGQYCSPVVADNIVYVSSSPVAMNVEGDEASVLWIQKDKLASPWHAEAVEVGGYVYSFGNKMGYGGYGGPNSMANGRTGDFWCLDMKTGEAHWVEKNSGCGTMTFVDGCLLCLTFTGDLFLLDPTPTGFKKITEMTNALQPDTPWRTHGRVWRGMQTPCWTVPVVARGKVYLRQRDEVVCYDLMK